MNLFKFKKNQQSEPEKPTIVDSDGDNMSVVTLIKDFIAGDVFLKETVQKQFLYVGLVPVHRIVHGEGTSGSIPNQLNLNQILEAGLSPLSALNCVAPLGDAKVQSG